MSELANNSASRVIYGLDDRPPMAQSIVLAMQHMLTMFGSTVAIPLLFGPALGMSAAQTGILISSVMLCSGLATFVQATFGSRLPIIQGVSFAFIAAFFGIIKAVREDGGGPNEMMQYIAGAILLGAVVEMVIGFSGMMGVIRRFLSPVVVGPVIMLIGLALFQHGAPKAGTDWAVSGSTIGLVILFSFVLSRQIRMLQLFPILSALIVVVTSCWLLSLAGVFGPDDPSYVNLDGAKASPWFRWDPREVVFPWGLPKFRLSYFVPVLAAYLASMIESFGDYHACAHLVGSDEPTPRQISRGIGCEGVGCMITSVFGGFASTSYSENIGLVGLTKVGSRYVVQISAILLIGFGLFGKLGALAAAIPGPVVGGLYCAMFGLISAVGVQQLARCDLNSDRNLFIAGFSLFMGLSIPAYFSAVASVDGIQAGELFALYTPTAEPILAGLPESVARVVIAIGSSGMAVAAILGLLLDNLLPGTDKERGLAGAGSVLVPESRNVGEGPRDESI